MSQFAHSLFPPSTLLTGLTSYWKLEETGAAARVDQLGTYNLTASNAPANTTGVIGNACDFVAASSQSLFSIGIPSTTESKMSLSTWLKRGATTSSLQFGWGDTGGRRCEILLISTSAYGVVETGAVVSFNQYANSLTGSYNHYVLSYDGGEATALDRIKLYVNGVFVAPSSNTGTNPTTCTLTGAFRVGREIPSGTFSNGQHDECCLWIGRALSASDASLLYGAGAPPPYPFGGIP